MINGLSLILVADGRGIPEENKEILENFQHLVYLKICKNLNPSDLLPRSSTMKRFFHSDLYYPGYSTAAGQKINSKNANQNIQIVVS